MNVESRILNADDLLKEAANVPGRSISVPTGSINGAVTVALRQLDFALATIEKGSPFLPSKLLPSSKGTNGP